MATYATGRHAKALCDRCGLEYGYLELKEEIYNGRPNGLRVCPPCLDKDHPQLMLGETIVVDAQALRHPRPDRIEPSIKQAEQIDAILHLNDVLDLTMLAGSGAGAVSGIDFAADGRRLFLQKRSGTLITNSLWGLAAPWQLGGASLFYQSGYSQSGTSVGGECILSPDGQSLFSIDNGLIQQTQSWSVWDWDFAQTPPGGLFTDPAVHMLAVDAEGVDSFAFGAAGTRCYLSRSGSSLSSVALESAYQFSGAAVVQPYPYPDFGQAPATISEVRGLSFNTDGTELYLSVHQWVAASNRNISLIYRMPLASAFDITSMAITDDGAALDISAEAPDRYTNRLWAPGPVRLSADERHLMLLDNDDKLHHYQLGLNAFYLVYPQTAGRPA